MCIKPRGQVCEVFCIISNKFCLILAGVGKICYICDRRKMDRA